MKIREKGVLWCTQDGLRFVSCYKLLNVGKKLSEIQNFQRFKESNFLRIFNRKRTLT